ncbi:MAG TPA: alpha/beta hydrolase [Thermoanaerobaculia bacterium]|nr:alpha/beta hydrolase [Thermoanaerobaculia bacterium]
MTRKTLIRSSDLQGVGRLAVDATAGLTGVVEMMHLNILRAPGLLGTPAQGHTRGITGLVYRSIRGVTRLVGGGMDAVFTRIVPRLGDGGSSPGRETMLAALNGVLGDHLATSGNPLAISMRLRRNGQALEAGRAVAEAIPRPGGKLLVLAHGLCMNDLQWDRKGHDHGAALARDLGYTPVYLHYNSGLHVSTNGRAFADLLESVVAQWPVPLEELAILGHSMGGLVARSACHYGRAAGHGWPRHLKKLVFLGTPHHGSPLEVGGNWVDVLLGASPYTAALARLGKIRSAGITDLRHGNLLDEDWEGLDRFERSGDPRRPVPLPEGVDCYALAAVTDPEGGLHSPWPSDRFVPLASALGRHEEPDLTLDLPESRQWTLRGIHHFDLLSEPEAYAKIQEWLAA